MVPRWPDVAPRWRRLGTGAAVVVGLAGLLQGAAPAATIPTSMAAMVARPPELGVLEPIPFAGDGLNHVLAVLPDTDRAPHAKTSPPLRPAAGIDVSELAALSAAGTIVAFEDGPDGRVVAVYDDGRRATVRDGAVVWLEDPGTTTAGSAPGTTATPASSTTAPASSTTAPASSTTAPATATAPATTAAPAAPIGASGTDLPDALRPFAARGDVRAVEHLGGGIWRLDGTFDPVELTASLEQAGIAAVEDHIVQLDATDPYSPYQWNLENDGPGAYLGASYVADADIDADALADGATGDGVVVAVVDSGANLDLPDLEGQAWTNTGEVCGNGADDDLNGYVDDCHGWNTASDNNVLWTPTANSHGTSVASIIAAHRDNGVGIAGVAPGVSIMNLAAMPSGSGYESDIIEAINYAIVNGADVINLSLGRAGGSCGPAYEWVFDRAAAAGIVVAVAAGNSGANLATSPHYPAACDSPIISVGASDGADRRSSFSNYGSTLVDLTAPGTATPMLTGTGSVVLGNGTSMAAPHVAAAAALVMQQHPSWDPAMVTQRLLGTVDAKSALAGTSVTGGRLNAAAAADDTPPTTTTAPTTTTRPPVPENPWQVRFTGFGHPGSNVEGTITVSGADPSLFSAGVQWQLSVLSIVGGETYGVMGLPLTIDGEAARTGADTARVAVSEQTGTFSVNLSTWLPPGRYAFIVEAGVAANSGRVYGRPAAVIVDVDGASATTVTTAPPAASTTTGPTPASTTTSAAPAAPTTAPAGQPVPTQPPAGGRATTTTVAATPGPSTPAPTAPGGGGGGGGSTPGGGGGSATTAAPAPSTSAALPAPTTAAAPSTTAAAPGAPPWRPDPVTPIVVGAWGITSIDPNWVAVGDDAAVIEIHGSFPQVPSYVFVGTQQAQVLHAGATLLRIKPPTSMVAGVRPLTISWGGEVRLSVSAGLWYVDPDGTTAPTAPPPPTTSTPPQLPPPTTGPAPTGSTIVPGPPSVTTTTAAPAPTTTSAEPPQATTTTLAAGLLRSSPIFANSAQLRGGLTVRKVIGNNPLRDVLGELDARACTGVDCNAFVI